MPSSCIIRGIVQGRPNNVRLEAVRSIDPFGAGREARMTATA